MAAKDMRDRCRTVIPAKAEVSERSETLIQGLLLFLAPAFAGVTTHNIQAKKNSLSPGGRRLGRGGTSQDKATAPPLPLGPLPLEGGKHVVASTNLTHKKNPAARNIPNRRIRQET